MHDSSLHQAKPAALRASTSLSELTGADVLFEALLENLLPQVRRGLPQISAQEIDTRLRAFRPQFEAIYGGVLREHLGAAQLPKLVNELLAPHARAYFEARRSMSPELGRRLQGLSLEMGNTKV